MRLPVQSLLGSGLNAPDMRSVNAIQLLNLIREHGPVSRAELARLSGMSKPAVSEQVNRLIGCGMVLETGIGQASEAGGKRPTLVEFHADARVGLIALSAMEIELGALLDRRVDLRTPGDLSRHFRDEVVRTAETQYTA